MRKLGIILLIILANHSYSQGIIKGSVYNSKSDELLANANVIINELKTGSITNEFGQYIFQNVPEGKYTITVSFIGYEQITESVILNRNSEKVLDFRLIPEFIELKQTVITATRTYRNRDEIPSKIEVITADQIEQQPIVSADDILRLIPNVVVNRSWGIFSKNGSITMRGMDGSSRALVLYNGTPMNKTAGGTLIWEMINTESIEKIEVIKGPNSAIYGMNAMSGVINIITKSASDKLQGSASVFGGSYKVHGGKLSLGERIQIGKGHLSWQLFSDYSAGDGYIIEPEATRSPWDVPVYLQQASIGIKTAYEFSKNHKTEIEYNYYNGLHGGGREVFELDGAYDLYNTHLLSLKYEGTFQDISLNANLFMQNQNYDKLSESMNSTGTYKLSETFSFSNDYGFWLNASKKINDRNTISIGIDTKQGWLDAESIYRTSTDILDYQGKLSFVGIFIQNEIDIISKKLRAIIGIRADYACFNEGELIITEPTSNTGFANEYKDDFTNNSWTELSPKLSFLYQINNHHRLYASYGTGFMPPKIDDLVRSGKITKGFKLANPSLSPETLTNFEIGGNFNLTDKIIIDPAIYYSIGKDFVDFFGTGDSVDTGGSSLKAILQKRNISKVRIFGFETSVSYQANKNIFAKASYTFNDSRIKAYDNLDDGVDIIDNFIIEVPQHQISGALYWKSKIFNASLIYTYLGKQWYDIENLNYIDAIGLIDMKLSKNILKQLTSTLTIQNLLDKPFVDRKGRLSPGRFVMLELKYKIN